MTHPDRQLETAPATSAVSYAFDTAGTGPDDAEPDPQRRLAGGLVLAALGTALVAVMATFQTLYSFQVEYDDDFGGGGIERWRVSGWTRTASFSGQPDVEVAGIPMGLVLAVAAVVLVVGGLAAARPRARVVGSCLTVAGGSGVVTGVLVVILERREAVDSFGAYGPGMTPTSSVGSGGWLLLLATGLALLCAVLAVRLLLRSTRAVGVPSSVADPATDDDPATEDPAADDAAADGPPEPDEPPAARVPDARLPEPADHDGELSPWDSEPGWEHRPASAYQRRPDDRQPSGG